MVSLPFYWLFGEAWPEYPVMDPSLLTVEILLRCPYLKVLLNRGSYPPLSGEFQSLRGDLEVRRNCQEWLKSEDISSEVRGDIELSIKTSENSMWKHIIFWNCTR